MRWKKRRGSIHEVHFLLAILLVLQRRFAKCLRPDVVAQLAGGDEEANRTTVAFGGGVQLRTHAALCPANQVLHSHFHLEAGRRVVRLQIIRIYNQCLTFKAHSSQSHKDSGEQARLTQAFATGLRGKSSRRAIIVPISRRKFFMSPFAFQARNQRKGA
ncbi:hypothetical protein [Yoonia sp. 2307UL14-13]|uniref:hypothetical protein n=1 Tax=Yoonia sp. 2307UL14-13 TaxID=3126506 RepID=UPI003097B125